MNLFMLGDFTLNSGAQSCWKLECDALTDEDIKCLAWMIREMVGPFSSVEGVPRGGLRFAEALQKYTTMGVKDNGHLIVDDVLTTGGSMERLKSMRKNAPGDFRDIKGAVVFARGPCPSWIGALCILPECFWIRKP